MQQYSAVLDALEETPLTPIIHIIMSGKFAEPPAEPIGKGETVLGEFSVFEKALWTVMENIAKLHNNMEKHPIDSDVLAAAERNVQTHEVIQSLFWRSIKDRFEAINHKNHGSGIALREGYQVVALPAKRGGSIEDFLGMLMGGIGDPMSMIAEMEHDCANCPQDEYDRCEALFKKPRA